MFKLHIFFKIFNANAAKNSSKCTVYEVEAVPSGQNWTPLKASKVCGRKTLAFDLITLIEGSMHAFRIIAVKYQPAGLR